MFRIKKETRNTILWIAIPLIASLVIFQSGLFLIHAVVPSASMQPTMKVGSHFVGNHMAFWFRKPKVDEIIFFKKDLLQNGRK